MSCPGCGSKLWNGEKCAACGRLASDTSRRLGDYPPPPAAAWRAVPKGAAGGALAGFLGGGPVDLQQFGNQVLLAGAVGAALGLTFALVYWFALRERNWVVWLAVPGVAAGGAVVFGAKQALDLALGLALAPWGNGLVAAALGAVVGGLLAAGFAYLLAARREARRSAA
jgi:hypothetical protein